MTDAVPSVVSQGFRTAFVRHEPGVRNYNSGLVQMAGREFLATRRFNRDTWRCEIVINELVSGEAHHVRRLELPRAMGREWHEDARLFWHNGVLHMAYTEGQYWSMPWVAVQKVALLDDEWNVKLVVTIGYGENSLGQEKNWQFFSHRGKLFFVCSLTPHIVVELDATYQPCAVFTTEWAPLGIMGDFEEKLRGGTPPVRVGEYYVTFPHFHTKHPERSRRYGFNACAFEARPPFQIVGLTEPLVIGSAHDPTLPNLAYPHYHPIVVFPCGALHREGLWTVSAGINDSFDALFEIPHAELQFEPIAHYADADLR